MTRREKDALVAEAMGRQVLGLAWCFYGPAGWSIYPEKANDRDTLQPVELEECLCADLEKGISELDRYFKDRLLGHSILCLRVVENWTSDRYLIEQMFLEVTNSSLAIRFVEELTDIVIRPTSIYTPWNKADVWWMLQSTPDQQCQAFLRAKGYDV
jgi:hypothetical protein